MRKTFKYQPKNYSGFKVSLLKWANEQEIFCALDSNALYVPGQAKQTQVYQQYETLIGVGKISEFSLTAPSDLDAFRKYLHLTRDWLMGHFSYDFKNYIEKLSSKNTDSIGFQPAYFFQPKLIINFIENRYVEILYFPQITSVLELESILHTIQQHRDPCSSISEESKTVFFRPGTSKKDYISIVNGIKRHISKGNIYELNYCINYHAENVLINPVSTWLKLIKNSPAPFSCLYKNNSNYLISSSPERFIQKKGYDIISQPMKGTIRRGNNELEDEQLKKQLTCDIKERAENIMITDLVRNDLSKIAIKNSVTVEEQCGLYTFKNVHQLISTIKAKVDPNISILDIIKAVFPMGSMTGAPKIRAMQLIDEYESFSRGLFSGCVGYTSPKNDFDFNVVIRSILLNQTNKTACINVGSAITALSDPEYEYEECLLKARALLALFEN